MNKKEKKKQSWLGRGAELHYALCNPHCAGTGLTAFATTSAASIAVCSNDLQMTKGLRLAAVGAVGEVA